MKKWLLYDYLGFFNPNISILTQVQFLIGFEQLVLGKFSHVMMIFRTYHMSNVYVSIVDCLEEKVD